MNYIWAADVNFLVIIYRIFYTISCFHYIRTSTYKHCRRYKYLRVLQFTYEANQMYKILLDDLVNICFVFL